MKIKWQIPAICILLLIAGCSKEKETMSGELIIEDLIVGDGAEAEKNSIVTVNYTGLLTDGTKFLARDDSDAELYRQKVGDVK